MSMLSRLFTQTVTVEPYLGERDSKPAYDAPVVVRGFLEGPTALAIATGGDVSSSTGSVFYTDLANAALFPVKSRVTSSLLAGSPTVVKVDSMDGAPILGPITHLAVSLQ